MQACGRWRQWLQDGIAWQRGNGKADECSGQQLRVAQAQATYLGRLALGNGHSAGDGRWLKAWVATRRLASRVVGGCGQTCGARSCRGQLEVFDVRIAGRVAEALALSVLAHFVRAVNGGSAATELVCEALKREHADGANGDDAEAGWREQRATAVGPSGVSSQAAG